MTNLHASLVTCTKDDNVQLGRVEITPESDTPLRQQIHDQVYAIARAAQAAGCLNMASEADVLATLLEE